MSPDEYIGPAITYEAGVWTATPHRTSDWPQWAGGHHADPERLAEGIDYETAHEWPRKGDR
jgi:hypothetical protein